MTSETDRPVAGLPRRHLLRAGALSVGALPACLALPLRPAAAQTPAQAAASVLDSKAFMPKSRLDALVAAQYPIFNEGAILPPFDAARQGARYDVTLYRITTSTTVPETKERVKISGLLAVPHGVAGPLPTVSWQHGTILSFDQVPSNLTRIAQPDYRMQDGVDSMETLFNIQRLAGAGYAVIAADYLGKGPYRNGRAEAYAVKDATVQTCRDILAAGRQALRGLGHADGPLFLNGWSQGALNTQWLLQDLQRRGVPVAAAAVQSPFNDLNEALRFWTGTESYPNPTAAPYPKGPDWVSLCLIIVLGSYQQGYRLDGLLQAAIKPKYHARALKYWADYRPDFTPDNPVPPAGDLLVDGFFDRFTADVNAAFLRQVAANRATYWRYGAPIRFFYGLADEAIHPVMARRPLAAGGGSASGTAVSNASHRATFLASLYGEGAVLQGDSNVLDSFNAAPR